MRLLTIFFALCGTTALAGSWPEDLWTISGSIHTGLSDRVSRTEAFTVADASARLTYGHYTAELGLFGRGDALDTPHETYGALGVRFGQNGHLSFGVPRPAYDSFAVSHLEKAFPGLSIERVSQTRSSVTFGAMFANWLPYGATVMSSSGDVRYGVSTFFVDGPDIAVINAGVGADFGDWAISAAIEATNGEISGKAQISRSFGRLQTGISYFAPSRSGAPDVLEGYVSLTALENIDVAAVILAPTNGAAATGGVTAQLKLADQTDLSVGYGKDGPRGSFIRAGVNFSF